MSKVLNDASCFNRLYCSKKRKKYAHTQNSATLNVAYIAQRIKCVLLHYLIVQKNWL